MRKIVFVFAALACMGGLTAEGRAEVTKAVYSRAGGNLWGDLCKPRGAGPFPAVIYYHGGVHGQIGGAPRQTCEALAEAGFVGFSPYRRLALPLREQLEDVAAALEYVKGLEGVDRSGIGVIGFSSGGHLALRVAARNPGIKAAVILAPAPGGKGKGAARVLKEETRQIKTPVLFLVAENDHVSVNHVKLAGELHWELQSRGKPARLMIYPPYGSDGHQMFFEIGPYWKEVVGFLKGYL